MYFKIYIYTYIQHFEVDRIWSIKGIVLGFLQDDIQ